MHIWVLGLLSAATNCAASVFVAVSAVELKSNVVQIVVDKVFIIILQWFGYVCLLMS
eukprot:GDKH01012246.1.p2 GENE.GDKH01012246.1~~GDKH01012246.1.p2  ORF type:complete len:57 (+),score=4.33 GDKH01012246.1:78-248(+)